MSMNRLAAVLALAGASVLIVGDDERHNDELMRKLASADESQRDCDVLGRGLGQLARMRIVEEVPELAYSTDWLDRDNFLFKADRKRLNELASDTTHVLMSCSHRVRPTAPPAHHKCSRSRRHDCAN